VGSAVKCGGQSNGNNIRGSIYSVFRPVASRRIFFRKIIILLDFLPADITLDDGS
jgi:hypothetical protein